MSEAGILKELFRPCMPSKSTEHNNTQNPTAITKERSSITQRTNLIYSLADKSGRFLISGLDGTLER